MPRYNKESFLDLLNEDQPNRNDLILSIDRLFYDTENLEDQSKIFRIILDQSTLETLKAIKKYVELSTKVKKI